MSTQRPHLHVLGVCGTFMAGVAMLARELGHRVTGSDANAWPPMSEQLAEAGIEVMAGYEPRHLDPAPDLVVVGNVMRRGNPCVEYLLDRGIEYRSGPEWLARTVLHGRHVLAVAGTHGKTTTSAMLAWILEQAGCRPGFLVGGLAHDFPRSARLGAPQAPFVIEADEYDTAFFDKRSKFVHYRPRTVVLNNLEFDHADIFPDLAAIERQFHHLVRTVPGTGRILRLAGDAALERVLAMGCWTPVETFGPAGHWSTATTGRVPGEVEVREGGAPRGRLRPTLPGHHNLLNALAAIAAASAFGVAPETACAALARFGGVRRRLELRGEAAGVRVYDDFAHHPTAISASIEALRADGDGRLIALLEPASNTMRLGVHRERLGPALAGADAVWILDTAENAALDARALADTLGEKVRVRATVEEIATQVARSAAPGDRILVMSNAAFGGIHAALLARLGAAAPGGSDRR